MSRAGWLLAAVSAVVVAAIVIGLRAAGSPEDARREGIDERRVQDIRSLAEAIGWRHRDRQGPIEALYREAIRDQPDHAADPVTHEPYRFRLRADGGYDLGAHFDRARPPESLESYERAWAHGAGDWWFEFPPSRLRLDPAAGHAGP